MSENLLRQLCVYLPPHGCDITISCREEQVHDAEALCLILLASWILLVGRMLEVVITVEVEHMNQLL